MPRFWPNPTLTTSLGLIPQAWFAALDDELPVGYKFTNISTEEEPGNCRDDQPITIWRIVAYAGGRQVLIYKDHAVINYVHYEYDDPASIPQAIAQILGTGAQEPVHRIGRKSRQK